MVIRRDEKFNKKLKINYTGNAKKLWMFSMNRSINNIEIISINYWLKQKEAIMRPFSMKIKAILKKSWRISKQVINKKKDTSSCSKFQVNQEITTDKTKIDNGFNQYFINIGPTLADKIPQDNKCPTTYMENRILESMVMSPVVQDGVQRIIKFLKESSAGWDAISARVAKATYSSFITPLTHSMNISLLNGVFSSKLKITRVIPFFKSGEPSNFFKL